MLFLKATLQHIRSMRLEIRQAFDTEQVKVNLSCPELKTAVFILISPGRSWRVHPPLPLNHVDLCIDWSYSVFFLLCNTD